MSVLPSGNQLVHFLVYKLGLTDTSGVAAWASFDGQPWAWLPINALQRQLANLHSCFMVTGSSIAATAAIMGHL